MKAVASVLLVRLCGLITQPFTFRRVSICSCGWTLEQGIDHHSWRSLLYSVRSKSTEEKCQTVDENQLNTLRRVERGAAGAHRHSNKCEKFNSPCLSHSDCGGLRPPRGAPSYLLVPFSSLTGPNTQELLRGWSFLMPDLCPCAILVTSAQHPAILFKLPFHHFPPPLFSALSLLLNLIWMTRLTFFILSLCYTLFSGVSHGKQNEVDPCVYVSVVPPPYCGIEVALWGLGAGECGRRG